MQFEIIEGAWVLLPDGKNEKRKKGLYTINDTNPANRLTRLGIKTILKDRLNSNFNENLDPLLIKK